MPSEPSDNLEADLIAQARLIGQTADPEFKQSVLDEVRKSERQKDLKKQFKNLESSTDKEAPDSEL